jgi:hypothetical protein
MLGLEIQEQSFFSVMEPVPLDLSILSEGMRIAIWAINLQHLNEFVLGFLWLK